MILRHKERLALLRLYQSEIEKILEILYLDPNKAGDLNQLLPLGRIEELAQECEDRIEFGKKLYKELSESPLADTLYNELMAFLVRIDRFGVLHKLLSCVDENTRRSEFHHVLANLDGFMKFTDPNMILQYLDSYPQWHQIVSVLKEEIGRLDNDPEMAKKLVLRTIPQLGRMSVFDVLYVIYTKSSPNMNTEAMQFVESLQPNFLRAYEMVNDDRRHPRGRIAVCPIESSVTELMMQMGTPSLDANPRFSIVNFLWDRLPHSDSMERMIIESVQNRVHMQNPIILRDYQKELCQIALDGKNTIVTAPTGSGKTVIAANILKNHFQESRERGRKFKALFMTPNSVILQQQADSLSLYLNHLYQVQIIQGSDNVPTRNAIHSKDLIVATPQMIVNLCNEHLSMNFEMENVVEEFYLSNFSIIIFDECHATQKNTPYSNIMKIYHKLKNTGVMPEGHRLPQIVGLTASLGVGAAKDIQKAISHVADLCANMDVQHISVVRENIEELRNFSPIVPDKCRFCTKNPDDSLSKFSKLLSEMMKRIEDDMLHAIKDDGTLIVSNESSNTDLDFEYRRVQGEFKIPPLEKDLECYQGWVANQIITVSETKMREKHNKIITHESLEVLQQCYLAHCLNSNFNSKVAFEFLNDWIEEKKSVLRNQMVRLWEEYASQLSAYISTDNQMIKEVVKYLVEQNNDFRAIIFVKTRNDAVIMSKILNETDELMVRDIKSEYISGLNRGNDDFNASKRVQKEKLEKFANGDIKVLIATSVAEEGLDIAKCNLVIKYNYATNEIAHVQRRGRGRALNSVCVLITNLEKLKVQEEANRCKEGLMNSAIAQILRNDVEFKKLVDRKTKEIWKAIQQDEIDRENQIQNQIDRNISYDILCGKCNILLCKHSDMRSRNTQYYVCNPAFWNMIRINPISREEQERDAKFCGKGKVMCNQPSCGNPLGRIIEVNSIDLPCITATSIVLEFSVDGMERRKTVKKWKEILTNYFTPLVLRTYDIQLMKNNRPVSFEYSHA